MDMDKNAILTFFGLNQIELQQQGTQLSVDTNLTYLTPTLEASFILKYIFLFH